MLHTIDILIGFTVVMLILSTIVTMLVQFVVTTVMNLKGRELKDGVAELLALLDKNGLSADEAKRIADDILRNSLIAKKGFFGKRRLADAVHREELATLILDFAGGADLSKADALTKGEELEEEGSDHLRARLGRSLKNNGINDDPADILKAIRQTMLALEESRPELANDVRQNLALLTHASSEFMAKLNAWFDQTIDRTIDSFTTRARRWTIFFSLAVALFFQVNSFDLIRRLSVDPQTRQMLVDAAITNPDRFAPSVRTPGTGNAQADTPPGTAAAAGKGAEAKRGPIADSANSNVTGTVGKGAASPVVAAPPKTTPSDALQRIRENEELNKLVDADLISWPPDFSAWWTYWASAPGWYQLLVRLFGVLLTVSLLALGAPVWYEILKNLINLRSVVAQKDDAQRLTRQTSQEPSAKPSATPQGSPAPDAAFVGERGDLEAVG